jgi:two-component system nitrate/nitrite sensor histidine kinase NarX
VRRVGGSEHETCWPAADAGRQTTKLGENRSQTPLQRLLEKFPKSLVFRTGLTLAAIVLLALVSIVASVVVADRLEGDAEAINVAGSLRMQSYHIGLLLDEPAPVLAAAIADFDQRLNAAALQQAVRRSGDGELHAALAALQLRWLHVMKPLLQSTPVARDAYRQQVDTLVADANHFVDQLQYASEEKISTLRIVQGTTMFLTLMLVFGAMYGLISDVITPLYELVAAARAAGVGDFSHRVEHTTDDELGVLGHAFNNMADNLSRAYGELEARVQQKTAELQRNNEALEMLYRMSRLLAEPGNIQRRLPAVLGMLAVTLQVRPAFFASGGGNLAGGEFRIVTPEGEFPSSACRPDGPVPGSGHRDPLSPHSVLVFPVATHNTVYGQLNVESAERAMPAFSIQLMRSAAEILATAMSLAATEENQRRILLMEERAVIARELHDSLAQSLSYQKIQVSRLDALLARGASAAEVGSILEDLRDGLNSAYRQLRELLTTFRLRIDGAGLDTALAATVEEFRERGLNVQLDYRLQHCPLAASEEIHVLHAVREALSNVLRHASASQAAVSLRQLADGHVETVIEDDGIGMPAQPDKRQHHGLIIIRERAGTLGGGVEWKPVLPHGTRVTLNFRPAYLNT